MRHILYESSCYVESTMELYRTYKHENNYNISSSLPAKLRNILRLEFIFPLADPFLFFRGV